MPKLKIDHIVSFSSEDPVHVANNLLSSDPAKKWKCQNAGEKQASVVLQLEKASVISSIDIGNENSAYVEVLASRSNSDDDYKVLLVMSSFMTPLEARQSTNINKVRMFTRDQLSKPECDQKWLRIKIVCTQPFNRHVQYGLSFVNFYTPEEKVNGAPVHTTVGKFAVRPESPTSSLGIGSLFARRKELQTQEPLKGAAAIREASSASSLTQQGTPLCKPKLKIPQSSSLSSPSSSSLTSDTAPKNNSNTKNDSSDESSKPLKRNRNELLYSKDEEEPNEKIDKIIQKKMEEVNKAKQLAEEETPKKLKKETKTPKAGSTSADEETPKKARKEKGTPKADTSTDSAKRKNKHSAENESKKQKVTAKERRPFSQLLKGVSLVISGIQNPDRADLRTKALEMGAKYKPNWEDDTCTHLICAFTNTPKFQQVEGKGKIVRKNWIEDCYSQRKRLPWRQYALDKSDQGKDESEDEIWEEIAGDPPSADTVDVSDESTDDEGGLDFTKMNERIARLQAVQQSNANNLGNNSKKDDENDEEDKDEQKDNTKQKDSSPKKKDDDIFSCSTDEEEEDDDLRPSGNTEISKNLPDLFDMKTFYVDEILGEETRKLLERYIIAYNGIVTESSGDDVDIVIGSESSTAHLTEKNPNAVFLRPDWVCECHITQSYVPVDAYKL